MNELDIIKKNEIAQMTMQVEFLPAISNSDLEISRSISFPWTEIKALGTSFQPINSMLQQAFSGGGGSGIYFVNTQGKSMFKSAGEYIGSLKGANGGVGGGQARLIQLPCDPTMLCVAATLASVEKKLDDIKDAQREMMDFLVQKEKSDLRGELIFLSDILTNYKYNWNNEQYKRTNYDKVLDVKRNMEKKIDFYREQIASRLRKHVSFHSDQDVKKLMTKIENNFAEYQLAVYLFSFSTYLEVVLLENYNEDFLNNIKKKIENYSLLYREFYTECYNQLDRLANTSFQSHLLKGLASANTNTGKVVAKIPVISKTQLDENLIEVGNKLEKRKDNRIVKTMSGLVEKQGSYVRPFVENILLINSVYNQAKQIYFDKENLYIGC